MNFHALSVNIHFVTGVIALTTFWIAALAPKGSRPHIWSGRIYLVAMLGIILTGIPLVAGFAANGNTVGAAFLGFLLALVGWTCWCAWRAIRDRRHPERYAGPVYWFMTWLVLTGGAGVATLGIVKGAALLVVMKRKRWRCVLAHSQSRRQMAMNSERGSSSDCSSRIARIDSTPLP